MKLPDGMERPNAFLIDFDVPYSFRLNDSLNNEISEEEGNRLDEDLIGDPFTIVIDGIPAHLLFKKESTSGGMMFQGAGFSIPRDRLGRVLHSRVRIIFEESFINTIPSDLEVKPASVMLSSTIRGFDNI